MLETAVVYATLTLVIALVCGLWPVYSSSSDNPSTLRMLTYAASGIILASALLVVVPEGYELATGGHSEHSEHAEEDALAGSMALVLLEVDRGDINASVAIEEIEALLGGHDAHEEHAEEAHAEEDEGEEHADEHLSESVFEVIESYEEGTINESVAVAEIDALLAALEHDEEAHGEEEATFEFWMIGAAMLVGFLLMLVLEGSGIGHAVHEEHHDHAEQHDHEHVHHSSSGWLLLFGLTLHSATDGLAIGAALASGSVAISAAVVAAVIIHKGPAAFSLGVFSMHERATKNESVRDVIIFALATPVMIAVAFIGLEDASTAWIGMVMLFSAGTFLYVATVDTLPDMHNPETGRRAMLYVLAGAVLFMLVLFGMDAAGLMEHGH